MKLRIEVDVDGVPVDIVQKQVRKLLRDQLTQLLAFKKGTRPDPDTVRRGSIHWQTAEVLMWRGARKGYALHVDASRASPRRESPKRSQTES